MKIGRAKMIVFFFTLISILLIGSFVYASEKNDKDIKVKYIDKIELDGQSIEANSNDLFSITSDIPAEAKSSFVLSGKANEGVEISIYLKQSANELKKEDLYDKITVGKSEKFAKVINLKKGTNYLFLIAKKDSNVQISRIKIVNSEETFIDKVMKIVDNINPFSKK